MKREFDIRIFRGDITTLKVESIVNSSNILLLERGGINEVIHRAAGPGLLNECLRVPTDPRGRRCPIGEARLTGAAELPANYVIHTVGPPYNPEQEEECEMLLRLCYLNSLLKAKSHKLRSIAFPAIATGGGRYPVDKAARVAFFEVKDFFLKFPYSLGQVIFVVSSEEMEMTYYNLVKKLDKLHIRL